MKNISLGLVAATAVSGLVTCVTSPVQASNVAFRFDSPITTINFTGLWQFDFISSNGAFNSQFGIGKPPVTPPNEITEQPPGYTTSVGDYPGVCANCTIFHDFTTNPQNFFYLKSNNQPTLFSDGTTTTGTYPTAGSFASSLLPSTGYVYQIAWNDPDPDRDNNDFIVNAKPFRGERTAVPFPAIVPGVILAGMYFGSRALKRKQSAAA
ncbi:hypothetical protein [Tumidithrix helvetica]|uniref:hypothetical protein n=1 Tax=Tumidithrix helvetica TaxID=3457545 RepID=UPI003CC5B175